MIYPIEGHSSVNCKVCKSFMILFELTGLNTETTFKTGDDAGSESHHVGGRQTNHRPRRTESKMETVIMDKSTLHHKRDTMLKKQCVTY